MACDCLRNWMRAQPSGKRNFNRFARICHGADERVIGVVVRDDWYDGSAHLQVKVGRQRSPEDYDSREAFPTPQAANVRAEEIMRSLLRRAGCKGKIGFGGRGCELRRKLGR